MGFLDPMSLDPLPSLPGLVVTAGGGYVLLVVGWYCNQSDRQVPPYPHSLPFGRYGGSSALMHAWAYVPRRFLRRARGDLSAPVSLVHVRTVVYSYLTCSVVI